MTKLNYLTLMLAFCLFAGHTFDYYTGEINRDTYGVNLITGATAVAAFYLLIFCSIKLFA